MYFNRKIIYAAFSLNLLLAGCYKESDYYYSEEEILENLIVDVSPYNVPADGISRITFTYKIPVESDTTLTSLLLKTTNGKFLESDNSFLTTNFLKIDPSDTLRYVDVNLISSTVPAKNVIVTASLLNYQISKTVAFDIADPDTIKLYVDPFYIRNQSICEVLITSTVSSGKGTASKGTKVKIEYPHDQGIIDLDSTYSNIGGVAQFKYVFIDTSYVGILNFKVKTTDGNKETISASAKLQVID